MKNKEELNYKNAYYYLFNKITDIIKVLQTIQRKAEEISIDDTTSKDIEINVEEILKSIINNLKE